MNLNSLSSLILLSVVIATGCSNRVLGDWVARNMIVHSHCSGSLLVATGLVFTKEKGA